MTNINATSILSALATHYHPESEESLAICKAIDALEAQERHEFKHELLVTVGDFLDLIDCNRESEEIVEIGDNNGGASAGIKVCSEIWSAELERRTINSIGINEGNYRIWLNDKEA